MLNTRIFPDTIIYTDKWAAYPRAINGFNEENNNELNSEHFTVNHSQNFVAESRVNTQAIESFWSNFKEILRKFNYNHDQHEELVEYIGLESNMVLMICKILVVLYALF